MESNEVLARFFQAVGKFIETNNFIPGGYLDFEEIRKEYVDGKISTEEFVAWLEVEIDIMK